MRFTLRFFPTSAGRMPPHLGALALGLASLGVVAAAAFATFYVRGIAGASSRGQALVSQIQLDAACLNGFEWQAIAAGRVGGLLAGEMRRTLTDAEAALAELAALRAQRSVLPLRRLGKSYMRAFEREFALLEQGRVAEARAVDASLTDPAFAKLFDELEHLAASYQRSATRARLVADLGSLLAFIIALGAVLAPFARFGHNRLRRAERATREASERRQQSLIAHGSDALLVVDEVGVVSYVAGPTDSILGLPGERLLGTPLTNVVDDFAEPIDALLAAAHTVGQAEAEVQQGPDEGGKVLALVATDLSQNPDVRGVVISVRDITAQATLERELRQTQRLEAVGQLAGGVAHDFNNLLTAIRGYSDLLATTLAGDSGAQANVAGITKASDRAAALTQQLLAFSRRQLLEPKVVDLSAVLAEMQSLLHRVIPSDIEIVYLAGPGASSVRVDPGQFEQVVMNVVLNARDALPKGGRIEIDLTDVLPGSPSEGAGPPPDSGSYVRLRVKDNGIGMDAETRALAFEPFFTTKSVENGTGLGLSTVYGIAKQSNGYVTLDSTPGRGTTVSLYLPALAGEPQLTIAAPEDAPVEQNGSETILLVDDNELVREVVALTLRARGYDVIEAGDGNDALAIVRRGLPIDLVVTDLVMPGMGGAELGERLRGDGIDAKLLFISGYTEDRAALDGLVAGEAFLQKPFSSAALVAKVQRVLQQDTPLPEVAASC